MCLVYVALQLDHDEDVRLCEFLGTARMEPAAFYMQYVLPRIAAGTIEASLRDKAVIAMLLDFPSLSRAGKVDPILEDQSVVPHFLVAFVTELSCLVYTQASA